MNKGGVLMDIDRYLSRTVFVADFRGSKPPSRTLQQLSAPFRTVELTAILVGRGSHGSQECTPHRIRTAESAGGSDLLEALVRTFQLPARSFGSHLQNIVGWRFSQLAREHALEIANAHCGSVCQLLYGQIVMKVFRNPNLKLMNRLHFRCLCRQGSAQLSLSAWAAQEQNKLARYFMGNPASAILLDPSKR